MGTKSSGCVTLLLAAVISAISFILWVSWLLYMWLVLNIAGVSIDLWAMIEALSTAVAAAGVIGAGFIAYRELSELASSRHMEVADKLFNELNSRENVAARRWIFQNLPDDPEEGIGAMTPDGRAVVKQVLNSLDRVAFLTQTGWIHDEMILPWMNPMVVKAWAKLEPYVDYESQRRNEPDYYEHARKLAERCRDWRAKNLPDAKITWVGDAL